jgi:hypothetical protein
LLACIVVAVVPLLGSLAWIRRFHRLAGLIETEADYAQQQRERASQEAELASILVARLRAENVETAGGVLLRTLLHPAQGVVGGDFLGTAAPAFGQRVCQSDLYALSRVRRLTNRLQGVPGAS